MYVMIEKDCGREVLHQPAVLLFGALCQHNAPNSTHTPRDYLHTTERTKKLPRPLTDAAHTEKSPKRHWNDNGPQQHKQ